MPTYEYKCPECEYEFPETFAAWEKPYIDAHAAEGHRGDTQKEGVASSGASSAVSSSFSHSGAKKGGDGKRRGARRGFLSPQNEKAHPKAREAMHDHGPGTSPGSLLGLGIQGLSLQGRPKPPP